MTHLQIRALGKLQLQHDQLVVSSFPTHHVEELFAYLLLFPRVKHSRLKLIDLLWPDCSEEQGRGRLNTAVWRLRKLFDDLHYTCDDLLFTSRDWISLTPPPQVQIDFVTFVFAVSTLLFIRFPDTLFRRQEEPLIREIVRGWDYIMKRRGLVAMIVFFAIVNFLLSMVTVLTMPLVLAFETPAVLGGAAAFPQNSSFPGGICNTPRKYRA